MEFHVQELYQQEKDHNDHDGGRVRGTPVGFKVLLLLLLASVLQSFTYVVDDLRSLPFKGRLSFTPHPPKVDATASHSYCFRGPVLGVQQCTMDAFHLSEPTGKSIQLVNGLHQFVRFVLSIEIYIYCLLPYSKIHKLVISELF